MFLVFICYCLATGVITDTVNPSCPRDGRDGKDGRDGIPGRDGLPGRDGVTVIGPAGRDGIDGRDGANCIDCAMGEKGSKGEKGPIGYPGLKGTAGVKGEKGDSGKDASLDKKVLDDITKAINALRKENAELKLQISSMLDNNKKIKQSLLPAGYDKFSLYDIQWQSLHMAAAAACRGSTPLGGSGPSANIVVARPPKMSCTEVCERTGYKYCDAEVSIHGMMSKHSVEYKSVGSFYNYKCNHKTPSSTTFESLIEDKGVTNGARYVSYCCCRYEKS